MKYYNLSNTRFFLMGVACFFFTLSLNSQSLKTQNPILFADVPDLSIIRVGSNYYMSSTTMHLSPGLPIMKSTDLVNWKLVSYAYDTLANIDELNLTNGKNSYGSGSWASSLRYANGRYYVSTFAQTTGKTYVFSTNDVEKGPWKRIEFKPMLHDHSLFFDDDGKIYMLYGVGKLKLVELKEDFSGLKPGSEKVVIENASKPAGENIGLAAEGSQLFKYQNKYYLFNITWPKGGMRTVVIHRADRIEGPYEGRVGFQNLGIAQGGLIETPEGKWFSYLFRDYGAVGRIPYLLPVAWVGGWPVLGEKGSVPALLDLPPKKAGIPAIVSSDEFARKKTDPDLPLVWQWNHNPDNSHWSVRERKGFLRLKTGSCDSSFLRARNTLTQRTFGPTCSGSTAIDFSKMKEGDVAGLGLIQKQYGWIGVRYTNGKKQIVATNFAGNSQEKFVSLPSDCHYIYLKASCDFTNMKDLAFFYYSLDGKKGNLLGSPLQMKYTLPHFMGYRFALFNYSAQQSGGYVDFDFFRISTN